MSSLPFIIVHAPVGSQRTVSCILAESRFSFNWAPTMAIMRAQINGDQPPPPPKTASGRSYYAVKIPSNTGWDRVNSLMDRLRAENIYYTYTSDINEGISVNGEEKPFSHTPDDNNIPNEESDDDIVFTGIVKSEPPDDHFVNFMTKPPEGIDVHGQLLMEGNPEAVEQLQEFAPQNIESNSSNAVKDERRPQSRGSSGYHTTTDILTTSSSAFSQQHQLDHAAVDEELAYQNPVKEDKVFSSRSSPIKLNNSSSFNVGNQSGSNSNDDMDPLLWETMNKRATRGKRFDYSGFFPKNLASYINHPHVALPLAFDECTQRYNQTIQEKSLRHSGTCNTRKRGNTEVKPFQRPESIQESANNKKRQVKEMKPFQTQDEAIPKRPRGRPRKIKIDKSMVDIPVARQTVAQSHEDVSTTPALPKKQRRPRKVKMDQKMIGYRRNQAAGLDVSKAAEVPKRQTRSRKKRAAPVEPSSSDASNETSSSSDTPETVAPPPKRRRRIQKTPSVVIVGNALQMAKLVSPTTPVAESETPRIAPIQRKRSVKDVLINGDDFTDEETDRLIDDLMAATSLPSTSKQSEQVPVPLSSRPAEEEDEDDEDDVDVERERERILWVDGRPYVCKKQLGLPGHVGEVTVSNYCENPVGLQFFCNLCKRHEFVATKPFQTELPPAEYIYCRYTYGVYGHIGNIIYVETTDDGVNVMCGECKLMMPVKFP